tara:strand:+ start:243 stop:1358 length:1116 start_codon:yes stop_codon:yes gene_type:complete
MKLSSYNEWDPLKEVIVGVAESKAFLTFHDEEWISEDKRKILVDLSEKAFPQSLIDDVNQDLEDFCNIIRDFGAKVFRPDSTGVNKFHSTGNWCSSGINIYNTRDLHLVVGNTLIESASHMKHRYFEAQRMHKIFYEEYMENGFKWIAAPKPSLIGNYRIPKVEDGKLYHKLTEDEILFEAANTLRMGKDLIYLVSGSGNYLGAKWLQSILGDEYKVHTTEGIYRSAHIDSTLIVLRPGLVLVNGERVDEKNCPPLFDSWDKIYFHDIVTYPSEVEDFFEKVWKPVNKQFEELGVKSDLDYMTTIWTGMNLFSLDQNTVVVDARQTALIKTLESHKMTVIPAKNPNQYLMKGAFHCCTLDTVRDGNLESYF